MKHHGPRCPNDGSPMFEAPPESIEGTYAATCGVWWMCGRAECDARYLQPNIQFVILASMPRSTSLPKYVTKGRGDE